MSIMDSGKLFPSSIKPEGEPWNNQQREFIWKSALFFERALEASCNKDGGAICAVAISIIEIVLGSVDKPETLLKETEHAVRLLREKFNPQPKA